jgi:opacity protein-like surface antigen
MRNNKLLTTLAAVSTLGLSLSTFALGDRSGIYLGAQAGYTRSHYDLDDFLHKDFKKDELAGRAYLGYQLNQYLGLETGFTMLAGTDLPHHFGDVRSTHWDLLLKAGAPLGDSGFRADLKAGGAHVMWKFDANDVAKSVGLDDVSKWKIRPVAGASLSYNINRNIAIDASYLHVFGDPSRSSFGPPTVDLAMLGASFIFNPF